MSTKSYLLGPKATNNEKYVKLVQCTTERDNNTCWEEINNCTKNDTCKNVLSVYDYLSKDNNQNFKDLCEANEKCDTATRCFISNCNSWYDPKIDICEGYKGACIA